jgi:hypothetical protein
MCVPTCTLAGWTKGSNVLKLLTGCVALLFYDYILTV